MGNQESVSDGKYEVKKKINVREKQTQQEFTQNNQNNQNNKKNQHQSQQTHHTKQLYQRNEQYQNVDNYNKKYINKQKEYQREIQRELPKEDNDYYEPRPMSTSTKKKIHQNNELNRPLEKQQYNNALMERNMLGDVFRNNNRGRNQVGIFDYPLNSNDEIDEPKKNFDNIKFTPYNFKDEVDKFKNSIHNERTEFETKEKERRNRFDKMEKEKKKYLENEISKFEQEYNPWEILGLNNNDYNIEHIKKAYKKSALKYHPDRAGDKYQDKFQLITQAYIYLLNKVEESNYYEEKIKKPVQNMNYEDNINEGRVNIHIDKDKFDINKFNKIFEEYKVPSVYDKGYSSLMKGEIQEKNNEVFGQNFNKDIFNAHFDNLKKKKTSTDMIEYNEPLALESSLSNLNQSYLGMDDIDDFGAVNNNGLSYTDIKRAHVDETLLIDVSKVKYKTYNSIEQLENDRSNLSYNMSVEDKRRYDYMERKKQEDEVNRQQKQKDYDNMLESHYNKLNRKLIVNK